MITDEEREKIVELARRHGAGRVLLFGSCLGTDDGRDIDLGVEGLPGGSFFRFYGELLLALSRPVDLVDLGVDSKFTRLVRLEGLPIYG